MTGPTSIEQQHPNWQPALVGIPKHYRIHVVKYKQSALGYIYHNSQLHNIFIHNTTILVSNKH